MSFCSPPPLLELAMQTLLGDQALAISALEHLPNGLFPSLLREALAREGYEILKAMVQAWPLPCLHLGSFMERLDLETLTIALDGLDKLLSQKAQPRRGKMQVLDLREGQQHNCGVWCAATATETSRKRQRGMPDASMEKEQPLRVFIDLSFYSSIQNECQTYIVLWALQRKDSVHLCCHKLRIFTKSIHVMRQVLEMVDLSSIQEVEVHFGWELSTLAAFAPYLGQMRNLKKLLLSHIELPESLSPEEKESLITQFTSQLLMDHLQELSVDSLFFLEGHLDQVLRSLQSHLQKLALINCPLSTSDFEHLSCWTKTSQLKELDLSSTKLTSFSPELIRVLLERVTATLESLILKDCELRDPQLQAILPALSRCTQIRNFNFFGNHFSIAVLKDLLRHTARLNQLNSERYPTPLESYNARGSLCPRMFTQLCRELKATLKDIRQPKGLFFVFPAFIMNTRDDITDQL